MNMCEIAFTLLCFQTSSPRTFISSSTNSVSRWSCVNQHVKDKNKKGIFFDNTKIHLKTLRTKEHLEAWSVNNSYVWAVRLPKEVASAVDSLLKSNHLITARDHYQIII